MPDFPSDYIYLGEPNDTLYWRYSLRCRVEREEDKAYFWAKLRVLHERLLPIVGDWQDLRILSDQVLQRMIGKPDEKGAFRIAYRNASLGGLQRWNIENIQKIATRWLTDDTHLIDKFANAGRLNARFFEPRGCERVHFFQTEFFGLRCRLKYDRSNVFQSIPHDFWLRIGGYHHQHNTSYLHEINQALDIAIWQGALAEADADGLALEIGRLTGAKHIWKTTSGFKGETLIDPEDGYHKLRYFVADQFEDAIDKRNRFGSLWVDLLSKD
jgi:hypothetical protein